MTTKKTRKKKKTPGAAAWVKGEMARWEVMREEPPTPQARYYPEGRKYSQIGVWWRPDQSWDQPPGEPPPVMTSGTLAGDFTAKDGSRIEMSIRHIKAKERTAKAQALWELIREMYRADLGKDYYEDHL